MTIAALTVSIAGLAFVASVAYAGVMDLVTMKIRNGLVLFLLAAYAGLAPLAGWTAAEIGMSVASATGVLACTFILFGFGWIGGGDAKFATVVALWLGAEHTPVYLIYTTLFGGVLTLAFLQFRLMTLPAFCLNRSWITRLHAKETGVPYGIALATAALFLFPTTRWMEPLV
ncbi:A24 family peptidase [Microvirga roseola]|uniref:A24 family peptidase n=1 Tax=Microvirga roseola TaxID=2883126 RepID=UPI001E3EFB1C|nr:prepilin peptidase [Microvirga roseola]